MPEIPRTFKHASFTIDPSVDIAYISATADDGTIWFRTVPASAFGALMKDWQQLPPLPPRVVPDVIIPGGIAITDAAPTFSGVHVPRERLQKLHTLWLLYQSAGERDVRRDFAKQIEAAFAEALA